MNRRIKWALLAVTLLVAAWLRFDRLGAAAYRADTMHFAQVLRAGIAETAIWSSWSQMGMDSQMPIPVMAARTLARLGGTPPSDFWVRASSALFGLIAVSVMAAAGCRCGGWRLGVLTGAFMAVNPYHIQLSREPYFYAPVVAGSACLVWAAVLLLRLGTRRPRAMPWTFWCVAVPGLFLLLYSQFSGWWMAAVAGVFIMGLLFRQAYRSRRWGPPVTWGLAIGLLGLPLTIMTWGLPFYLKNVFNRELAAASVARIGGSALGIAEITWNAVSSMSWGTRLGGVVLFVCAWAGFVAALYVRRKWRSRLAALAGMVVLILAVYLAANKLQNSYVARRHVAVLMPPLALCLTGGVWFGLLTLVRWVLTQWPGRRIQGCVLGLALTVFVLPLLIPAWWSVHLPGSPTPYRDITRWCDSRLPSHALVVVDRWFESWNELSVDPATNVFYTFTVPSEPSQVAIQNHWRESVEAFFARYPDAAYLPVVDSYQQDPALGAWAWPARYFRQRMVFTNTPGLRLRQWGLAYRDDFYDANTNRTVVELLYNTRDDVLAMARERGQFKVVLYGDGWGYTKLWNRGVPGDFRDWRVLEHDAELDVYNLTPAPTNVNVVVHAVAINGSKRVQLRPAFEHAFVQGRIEAWRIDGLKVAPGLNKVMLCDVSRVPSKSILLVADVALVSSDLVADDVSRRQGVEPWVQNNCRR